MAAKKPKSAKEKKTMEIVPETSLSSEQKGARPRLMKLRERNQSLSIGSHKATRARVKYTDKGKGKAVEYLSDLDSDIEAIVTSKPMVKRGGPALKKSHRVKKRISPSKSPRKRCMDDSSSSEDDFQIPKKGRKAQEETDGHNVKQWDKLLNGVVFFGAKADNYNNEDTIYEIKRTLSETQFSLLKASCFGKVLELQDFRFQTQIVHNILFREVRQSWEDELWVDMNGKIMRFGLDEFAVMTGLKCVGSTNMPHGHVCRILYYGRRLQSSGI